MTTYYVTRNDAVEPTEDTPTDTFLRTRKEILRELGFTILQDEELTPTPDYALWNNYDPSVSVSLYRPDYLISHLIPARRFDPTALVVTHHSRSFRIPPSVWQLPDGRQMYLAPDGGGRYQTIVIARSEDEAETRFYRDGEPRGVSYDNTYIPAFPGAVRLSMRKAFRSFRKAHFKKLRDRVVGRIGINSIPHSRVMQWERVFDQSLRYVHRSFPFRGTNLPDHCTLRIRARLKEIGQMIAAAHRGEQPDVCDFMYAIELVRGYVSDAVANNITDAWNAVCHCGDEVQVAECGHVTRSDETHNTYDGDVCEECFDNEYVFVENTEDYRNRSDVYQHSDGDYYTYEEEDEDDYYDEDDDDDREEYASCIRGYSTDVLEYLSADPTIRPSLFGEFLMGIELEVMPLRGSRRESAEDTYGHFDGDYVVLKADGSLEGRGDYADGFEIVTAPRGLKEHIKKFKSWEPHSALRAWDTGKCGLHVHISSKAFSPTTLGKFIEFINARENDSLIMEIAGRSPESNHNAAEYCQREGAVYTGNPKKNLDGKSTDRYRMINVANMTNREAERLGLKEQNGRKFNTVELRIFKATLSKPRLLAQIEFAHAAVMFCRWASMRELHRDNFLKWLKMSAGLYPHLAKWFGVKANTNKVEVDPPIRQTAEC